MEGVGLKGGNIVAGGPRSLHIVSKDVQEWRSEK